MEEFSSFSISSPGFAEFLSFAIMTGVRWNLRVVLIYIFLIIKDVEHFLMCFSAIEDSSVANYLFSSVPNFYLGYCFLRSLTS